MENAVVMLRNIAVHLRFQLDRHGWPAAAGLALIASAMSLQFFGVEEARADAIKLRAEAAALRQRQAQQPNPEEAAIKRLAAIYASLPVSNGALEAAEIVHRAAEANGVKLANGEYRLVREGGTQLLRYQITLPARSSYPHLRAWLVDVMNAVPAAALDDISLRRDDVSSDSVEARARLTLFLRAP